MEPGDGAAVFAERVAALFERRRRPDGAMWSGADVAAALHDQHGIDVSARLITGLRSGSAGNPTRETLEALAVFFGVPAGYFFDDDAGATAAAEVALVDAFNPTGPPAVGGATTSGGDR